MEGFYKLDNGEWFFAPNFVYSKDYTLEKNGNREAVDGWQWYDQAPQEYIIWNLLNNTQENGTNSTD